MLTLKDLKQYKSLCAEIDEVNIEIASRSVSDTVSGSDSRFPYITHTVSIGGLTHSEENGKLMYKLRSLEEKRDEIERFVEGIEDSLTRRIFDMRFIKGLAWGKIAYRTNNTVASVKMRCRRYLKRLSEN